MSVEQTNTLDSVSLERQTGVVVLAISDHLDWQDEERHLALLSEKLESYAQFVESGQLANHVPDAATRKVKIKLYVRYPLSEQGREFAAEAENTLNELGIGFEIVLFEA